MPYPAKLSRAVAHLARYLLRVRRRPPSIKLVGVGDGCQQALTRQHGMGRTVIPPPHRDEPLLEPVGEPCAILRDHRGLSLWSR